VATKRCCFLREKKRKEREVTFPKNLEKRKGFSAQHRNTDRGKKRVLCPERTGKWLIKGGRKRKENPSSVTSFGKPNCKKN